MAVQCGQRGGAPGLGLLGDRGDGGAGVPDGLGDLGDPGADRGAGLVGGPARGEAGRQGGLLGPVQGLQGALLGLGGQAGERLAELRGEVPLVLDAEVVGGLGGLRPEGVHGGAEALQGAVRQMRGGVPGPGGRLTG